MADSQLEIVVKTRDETTPGLKKIESSIIRFVGAVSAALASIRIIALPIQQAAEFQKQLLDVAKTTEFTDRQITQLSKSLIELSKRLNVSATDLAKIAEIGGQLGVGSQGPEALAIFTEAASRFSSVLEVSAEEAGNAIAKIANIFQINIREAEKISSTLNELANNSTASGRDLIDIIQRIGTAGATVNFQQAAALAATGRDLGLTLETIGTNFNKIFLDLQTKAPQVAQLIGMPVEQFTDLLRSDGIAALEAYLSALSKLPTQQRAAVAEQITGGGRIFALVTSLVRQQEQANRGGGEGISLLRRNLQFATQGFQTGTSAIREQERVMQGLLAQIQILRNVFFALGEAIGRRALPYLTDLVKRLQELGNDPTFVRRVTEFAAAIGRNIAYLIQFVEWIAKSDVILKGFLDTLLLLGKIKLAGVLFGIGQSAVRATAGVLNLGRAMVQVATGMAQIKEGGRVAQGNTAVQLSRAQAQTAQAISTIFVPSRENAERLKNYYQGINTYNAQIIADEKKIKDARKAAADEIRRERADSRQRAQAQDAAGKARSATAIRRASALNVAGTLVSVKAETDALKALNAERKIATSVLEAQVTQAKGLAPALTPVAVVTGRIGAGFRAIGTSIVRFGALIGRFLLGPIGLIVITVVELLNMFGLLEPVVGAIARLLGISSEKEKEAARESQRTAQHLNDQRTAAAAIAEEYDANYEKLGQINAAGKEVADTALDYAKNWALVSKQIELTQGKLTDLALQGADNARRLVSVRERADAIPKELDAARKQLARVQEVNQLQQATGKGISPAAREDEERSKRRIQELEAEQKALDAAQANLLAKQKLRAEEERKVYEQRIAAARSFQVIYSEEGAALVELLRKQISATDAVKKAEEEVNALRKKGAADPGASDALAVAFAKAEANLSRLTGEAEIAKAALDGSFKDATPAALAFFQAIAPQGALTKLGELEARLGTVANAAGKLTSAQEKNQESLLKGIDESSKAISSAQRKGLFAELIKKDAELLKRSPIPFSTILGTAVQELGEQSAKSARDQKKAIEGTIAQYEALYITQVTGQRAAQIALTNTTEEARKQADQVRKYYISVVQSSATEAILERQVGAQEKIAQSAKQNADLAAAAYKNAQDDITKILQENARRITDFYVRENARAREQANERNRILRQRQADVTDRATSRQFDRERTRVQELGLGQEETQRRLDALQDQQDIIRGLRQSELERANAVDQVTSAQLRQSEILAKIKVAQADIGTLDERRKKATDPEQIKRLTAEISVQAGTVDALTKDYEEQVKIIEDLGRKQFPSLAQLETPQIVSKDEIAAQQERLNKLRVEAQQVKVEVARTESDALTRVASEEGTKLVTLKEQLDQVRATIQAAGNAVGEGAAANLRALGRVMAETVPDAVALSAELKKIGEGGINTDKFSADAATLKTQITEVNAAIQQAATGAVDRALAAGATNVRTVISSITQEYQNSPISLSFAVKPEERQRVEAQLSSLVITPKLEGVSDQLQQQLAAEKFTIEVTANITPLLQGQQQQQGGLFGRLFNRGGYVTNPTGTIGVRGATGGHVRGPGTSTSDSISAWLSDGEYVVDAKTTALFGPEFFAALQSISNRGRSAMARVLTPRIPRFAAGGPVLASALSGSGEAGNIDVMRVELNVGGQTVKIAAERQQAQLLARALKNLQRGI